MNGEEKEITQEKVKILSNIPDEILSNDKCKLLKSKINLSPYNWIVSKDLIYHNIINRARINIWIGSPINNTYEGGITVYLFGKSYDYDRVPEDCRKLPCYQYVDIAYRIADYLKLMGLYLL